MSNELLNFLVAVVAISIVVGGPLLLLTSQPVKARQERKRAMREYRIEITREDIRRGIRGDVMRCPTGLAMERAGAAGVYFPIESLPQIAQDFIRDFDAGRPVSPITFIMEDYRQEAPAAARAEVRGYPAYRPAKFDPRTVAAPARNYYGNERPLRFEPVVVAKEAPRPAFARGRLY